MLILALAAGCSVIGTIAAAVLASLPWLLTALLLFAPLAWYLLKAAADAFATYTWDEQGIEQRGWLGTRRLTWHELRRHEVRKGGLGDVEFRLFDEAGRRFVVDFDLLGHNGLPLLPLLLSKLAPSRAMQERELAGEGVELRPARDAAFLLVCFGALFAVGALGVGVDFALAPQPGESQLYAAAGGLAVGLGLLALAAALRRRVVRLSVHGISRVRGGQTDMLLWPLVRKIRLQRYSQQGQSIESITIEGDGLKLGFSHSMRGYPLLVETVLRRAGSAEFEDRSTTDAGPVWRALIESWLDPATVTTSADMPLPQVTSTAPAKPWVAMVLLNLGVVLAYLGVRLALEGDWVAVLELRALIRDGATASATVSEVEQTPDGDRIAWYQFTVAGREYEGWAAVSPDAVTDELIGVQLPVRYDLNSPADNLPAHVVPPQVRLSRKDWAWVAVAAIGMVLIVAATPGVRRHRVAIRLTRQPAASTSMR